MNLRTSRHIEHTFDSSRELLDSETPLISRDLPSYQAVYRIRTGMSAPLLLSPLAPLPLTGPMWTGAPNGVRSPVYVSPVRTIQVSCQKPAGLWLAGTTPGRP